MTATTIATQVARRLEQDNHITDMVKLHAGPKRYFKKRQRKYTTGNKSAYFAMRLGGSGAKGTYSAGNTIVGAGTSQLYPSSTYKNIETKIVDRVGYISIAGELMKSVFGGTDRSMLPQFNEELMSHFEMWANDWNITFFTGASEAIFRVSDTNPANITGNQWRVYVDTTADARFMQNVYSVKPGHSVTVAVVATHAQLNNGGGDPYSGVVRSIAEDGLSMIIEWEGARAATATDLTNDHYVRFQPSTAALMGKYGLYDFVGDSSSAYVDEGGSAVTNGRFPYNTNETYIDPSVNGEWSSIIDEQAGATFSVNDFDKMHEKIKKRLGHGMMDDYVVFGSPEIETQLVQESRIDRRWTPGAKSMDQTPDGRRVTDGGMTFEVDTHCPTQHVYFIDTSVLANDELDDKGPGFRNTPNQDGSPGSDMFTQDRTTDEYFAHTGWPGQRMTLQRNRHGLLKPNSGG